jgi:tetratricopeptide (TPR) repeat protein
MRLYFETARRFLAEQRFEEAIKEVTKVYLISPDNEEAKRLEAEIYNARQAQAKRREGARRWREEHLRKVESLQKELAEFAVREREEQEKHAIRKAKIDACLKRVEEFYRHRQYDKARAEIETVYAIDPANTRAQDLEMDILNETHRKEEARRVFEQRSHRGLLWKREEEARERAMNERRSALRKESVTLYRSFLKHSWSEGIPGEEETALLKAVRASLGISENDHEIMERSIRREAYAEALRRVSAEGGISLSDPKATDRLREDFGISPDQHAAIVESLKRGGEARE